MAKQQINRKSKSKRKSHSLSAYQIIVKGEVRNKALENLSTLLEQQVKAKTLILKKDRFGNVLRITSASVEEIRNLKAVTISVVKFNEKRTGISWNLRRNEVVQDNEQVTAQSCRIFIFPGPHVAFLEHKRHGPSPKQIEDFLKQLLANLAHEASLDCEIDVVSVKKSDEIAKIKDWEIIKQFHIEIYRPNPSGTVVSRQLRKILEDTSADKVTMDLTSKEKSGLHPDKADLLKDAEKVVEEGTGHFKASGVEDGKPVAIDSKKVAVDKFVVVDIIAEGIPLAELIVDQLKRFFKHGK